MRAVGAVFAGALIVAGMVAGMTASPAWAFEDEDPAQVSEMAGAYAGVAESCGLATEAYSQRVEELLRHLAGGSGDADQLISNFNDKKKQTVAREESERSIDCMDAKRRFEELPINQPGWTVDTGWAAEML